MTITYTNYGRYLESLVTGLINVVDDPMYCMLVTSAYTFSRDAHKFKSVISGEIVGSGYAAGGQLVTVGGLPFYDAANKRIIVPAGNMAWPSVTFTGATGAVLYMNPTDAVDDTTKTLIAYIDFGESVNRSIAPFYINWSADGVIKLALP
jgi:hypothetical protein